MSKEDIWISRVPVPIVAETIEHVDDGFEETPAGPRVPGWNTYSPIWAPVSIAADGVNRYLKLEDREPVDYARAIRTFPQSKKVDVRFRLAAEQADRGRLEIDLLGELGSRPVRLMLADDGRIEAIDGRVEAKESFAQGLEGTYFSSPDLTRPEQRKDVLDSVNKIWGRSKGSDWGARWEGFLEAPHTGEITFSADAADGVRLIIGGKVVIDGLADDGSREGQVTMTKGEKAPVTVEFASRHGNAKLVLSWAWPGQAAAVVADSALSHSLEPRIEPRDLAAYAAGEWIDVNIEADCGRGEYTLKIGGREVLEAAKVAEPCSIVYAVSFRTGEYRGQPEGDAEEDIPDSEDPVDLAAYRIDDVKTGE